VKNLCKCLSNTNPSQIGLYGCLTAEYIETSGTYQCFECKNDSDIEFIPVITDKSCIERSYFGISSKCLEAEKIGDNYSCSLCDSDYVIVQDVSTKIRQCYPRNGVLSHCLEGKLENGNLTCLNCVNNSVIKDNVCSCDYDSFSKDLKWCYKCDDYYEGNPGCDKTGGGIRSIRMRRQILLRLFPGT
jgi:hypothetical protein